MSRRASKASLSDGEFILECKAAYLSVFDDIKDEIQSQDELIQVLQQAGRNPSTRVLNKYWTSNSDSLTYDDFVDICRKEPITTTDDLMKAFRKIDINGDGYISLDELFKLMTTKGEKMSRSEVKKIIDEVDENKDGKLDYGEFCKMIVNTTEEFKKMSRKIMEKKEKKRKALIESQKRGEGSLGSQVSLRSTTSNRSPAERPMSASQRSTTSNKVGASRTSLKSDAMQDDEEKQDNITEDIRASRASLKSNRSVASRKTLQDKDDVTHSVHASRVSLQSNRSTHAATSLHEETDIKERKAIGASRTSLRSNKSTSSKKTVVDDDTEAKEDISTSRVSLKSNKSTKSIRSSDSQTRLLASRASITSHHSVLSKSEKSMEGKRQDDSLDSSESDDTDSDIIIGTPRPSARSTKDISSDRMSAHKFSMQTLEERPSTPKKRTSDGGVMGSVSSLKSGISSSRRSLLSVDDLPKPSPRSKTGSKSKCEAASKLRLAEPKNLREWKTLSSKGMFFVDEDDGSILSHQFTLDLTESSKVWLTIEPGTCKSLAHLDGPLDTSLFVLRSRPDQEGNILATFTEHRDGKGKYGVRCELSAGTYQLIPFTTGCRLGKRTKEPSEAKSLLQKKDGKYALSKAFRKALEDIFDLSDLDDNGLISREEFNLYNLRTSEEEVGDEEWEVVEERLELEKGEITKNGFLQLNELEAEDSNGDEDDMWVTLESMGFNKQLVMDEAHPFKLTVHIEDNDDADIEVAGIEPMIKKVEKALIQSVIDKCEPTKIKGMKDLFLYTYTGEARSTVILDNKSYSSVKLELDCQGSKNVLTNQESMEETFTIKGNSQQIAFHFIPEDESSEWSVKSNETILK